MEKVKTEDPIKILWCSDGCNVPSGYGMVTRNILSRLVKKGYECYNLSWQYFGMPIEINGVKMLPNGYHQWGADIIVEHITNIKPDLVISLDDLFHMPHMKDIDFHKLNTKWMAYVPMDGWPWPETTEDIFPNIDFPIAMSKYGQKVIKDCCGMDVPYVPHGVDMVTFKPNEAVKKESPFPGKFIIGSVFRNCWRKAPDRLIKAFNLFAEGKDDVVLYLHTDPKDPQGLSMGPFLHRLGPKNTYCNYKQSQNNLAQTKKVVFSNFHSIRSFPPDNYVAKLYNLFDIFILSTTGEGFGLPIIESQACGTPVIVPDNTTGPELVMDRGWLIPCSEKVIGGFLTEREMVDEQKLAAAMEEAYKNRELLKDKASKCRPAMEADYDWDKIADWWDAHIKACIRGDVVSSRIAFKPQ